MIETQNILNEILKDRDEIKNISLKAKDSETGEIRGFLYTYVANETLFLFTSKEECNKCFNYISNLQGEGQDKCWEEYITIPEGYVHPSQGDCCEENDHVLSYEEIADMRNEVVINLDTEIYFGDIDECPLKDGNHRHIKTIERTEDSIVLVY